MPNSTYLLSIDQGTTGTTVLLVDAHGAIGAQGYREFTQHYPRPGWVEHDAAEIWEVTRHAITDALTSLPSDTRADIAAIGIANQRETTVVWERKTGKPIHPAIVWQCRRTAERCAALKQQGLEELVKAKTGLVLDPYFSGTKVAWILDAVAGARERAERGELAFGTIDTWLLWNLTDGEVHKTDYTNASRTLLFNIETLAWDDTLLEMFNVPKAILPEVCPSRGIFGEAEISGLVGERNISRLEAKGDLLEPGVLSCRVPIAGIAGDQQAALFGQLCLEPGMAKNTYGTGCFLMLNTGSQRVHSKAGLLTTLACGLTDTPVYALEGSVFVAGAAVQWLRDGIQIVETAAETESAANRVADSDGVFVVPAFTGLGAPYWDAEARGAIFGLTRGTTREHIIRATLEAIAFQSTDVVTAMLADANVTLETLRVDGGAVANDFLMQFQADILGIAVERPRRIETTGLGAAYLAGLATGIWGNTMELEAYRTTERIFAPQMNVNRRAEKLAGWKDAVRRVMCHDAGEFHTP